MINNKYNYLVTLPTKRNFCNVKEDNYYKNLISKIINSSDNTEDYNLLKFKYQLIDYIITNLLNPLSDFSKEDYFVLRNNLTILDEAIIKDSSSQLLNLLVEKEEKIIEYINTLNSLYDFKCSYERIEVMEDDKKIYKIVPKKIVKEDIYLYIDELTRASSKYLANIINGFIDNNDLASYDNLEKMIYEDEEVRNEIFYSLNNKFEFLNDDKLLIIKDIINNYNKHYLTILKTMISGRKRSIQKDDLRKKRILDSTFEFYEKRRVYPYAYKG